MSRRIYFSFALLVVVVFTLPFMASADCDGSPTNGDDTFNCSGNTNTNVNGRRGDDVITNDGAIDGNLSGDGTTGSAGDDTLLNNGSVNGQIRGDGALGLGAVGGDDSITTNGTSGDVLGDGIIALGAAGGNDTIEIGSGATVYGNVMGDGLAGVGLAGGNDVIMILGTVTGNVYGDGLAAVGDLPGSDDVYLYDGSVIYGVIDGDGGVEFFSVDKSYDRLIFSQTVHSEDEYDALAALIANALPQGGSITINGVTYEWANFEELVNMLRLALAQRGAATPPTPECFLDGRLNNCDLGAPLAVYCSAEGVRVVDLLDNGDAGPAFDVTDAQVDEALTQAVNGGSNVLIAEANGNSLYALTSGELQVMGPEILEPGKSYTYLFPGDTCG